jgi:hypothetical protein
MWHALYVVNGDKDMAPGYLVYHADAGMYATSIGLRPHLVKAGELKDLEDYMKRFHPNVVFETLTLLKEEKKEMSSEAIIAKLREMQREILRLAVDVKDDYKETGLVKDLRKVDGALEAIIANF